MTTTEIYPPELLLVKQECYIRNLINDQEWIIDQVIIPKLPSFISTIKSILFYLILDKPFKLPITSNANDYLKGVITRNSFKITNLNLQISKLNFFNNSNLFKIQLEDDSSGEIELHQIKLVIQYLKFLMFQLSNLLAFIKASKQQKKGIYSQLKHNLVFLKKFNQIYQNMQTIDTLINNPIQSELFPVSHPPANIFNPNLNLNKLSIDLYLNTGEIFIELIFLKKIQTKPWCFINEHGVSFTEFVTKKFLQNKRHQNINQVIDYYLEEKQWDKFWNFRDTALSEQDGVVDPKSGTVSPINGTVPHSTGHSRNSSISSIVAEKPGTQHHHNHWFKNILSFQNSSETNRQYLNRNIKFNNSIYWILKNMQVKISDPILIIVNIKLNSVKNLIQNYLINLKNLIINADFLRSVTNGTISNLNLEKTSQEENNYNELLNEFFKNANDDLISQESTFDLEEFLKLNQESEFNDLLLAQSTNYSTITTNAASSVSSTRKKSMKSSYEDLDNLDVNFEILKELRTDFNTLNANLENWDGELIKEISILINGDSSTSNDELSCCEFDVFDV